MFEPKLSLWTKRSPLLFAALLNYTRKTVRASKISQIFWRKTTSFLPAASESSETEFLLSFPILFTMATSVMPVKSTKASTSHSSQRKCLLPLHQEERALPRKAFFAARGIIRTDQIFSSKSFFVEPRHRESFSRIRQGRNTSKRTGQGDCSKSQNAVRRG